MRVKPESDHRFKHTLVILGRVTGRVCPATLITWVSRIYYACLLLVVGEHDDAGDELGESLSPQAFF
jgi:hypothetical protein